MHETATQLGRQDDRSASLPRLSPAPAAEGTRIGTTLERLKATLDAGESEWTWIIVLVLDYAVAASIFLVMLAAVELAYHFG